MTLVEIPSLREQPAWKDLRAMLKRFVAARVRATDIEDVLQEVFLRVSRGLPELREGERLSAWVHQIARHTIADYHRRPRSQREEPTDLDAEQIVAAVDDDPAAASALAGVLTDFVDLLPPASRQALELTDLRGITQAEAARRVGLSTPGMKSRVQRARAQLRELLEACCAIEIDARGRVLECEVRQAPADLPTCCSKP